MAREPGFLGARERGFTSAFPTVRDTQNATYQEVVPNIYRGVYLSGRRGPHYRIERILAEGNGSDVFLARSRSGLLYALKIGTSLQEEAHHKARQSAEYQGEAHFLSSQVVGIEDFGLVQAPYSRWNQGGEIPYTEKGQSGKRRSFKYRTYHEDGVFPITIMRYYPEGSLDSQKVSASPLYSRRFKVQILADVGDAIDKIAQRIVHRDMKEGNVLLEKGRAHLSDFGISERPGVPIRFNKGRGDPVGTITTISPEHAIPQHIFSRAQGMEGPVPSYLTDTYLFSPQTDIHGATILAMTLFIDGQQLFFNKEYALEILDKESYINFLQWRLDGTPTNVYDALIWGLAYKPEERPDTFSDFLDVFVPTIEHPSSTKVIFKARKNSPKIYRKSVHEVIDELRKKEKSKTDDFPKTGDVVSLRK